MGKKGNRLMIIFISVCILFPSVSLWARDFREPVDTLDPLHSIHDESELLLPHGCGDVTYNDHMIIQSPQDSFDIRALCSFTLCQVHSVFALNIYYGVYLLVGPLEEGENPATIMEWWMNAAQYEYGLIGAFDLYDFHILFEYARTSQHPLRSGYSQVTTDVLKTGVAFPLLSSGMFNIHGIFRTGYVDLFDFWESSVDKPRTVWVFTPTIESHYGVTDFLSFYIRLDTDIILLRKGGTDIDFWAEGGILIGNADTKLLLFIEYFHSQDTEELRNETCPVDLLGLGFRFTVEGNTR
jgi:hypothetical protein